MLTVILHRIDEGQHTPAFIDLPASRWDVLEAKAKLNVDNLSHCNYEFEPPYDLADGAKMLGR